jgi:hypothetical protein
MSMLLFLLLVLVLLTAPACRTVTQAPLHPGLPVFAEGAWDASSVATWDDDEQESSGDEESADKADDDDHERRGIVHRLIFYIPNRVFDVFDIVRLRLRFGPGFSVQARATKVLSANAGFYTSFWIGLRGYRGEPRIPWPVGIESFAGATVSVVDAAAEPGGGPNYGPTEIGAGFQLALLGIDFGVLPLEIADLFAGLLTIDLTGDDY